MPTYFSRRPDKNMTFVCICGKECWSRVSTKRHYESYCAQTPIPPGYPGISFASTQNYGQVDHDDDHQEDEGEGEEDEDDADEATPSCNTNSATRSFGSEFAKATEMTWCLQKQSSELHQKTLHQLMEFHLTAKEHILKLRQELQEERSTRRLALQTLMETQAAHQEERQEWTVERLLLLAHQETQQKEHQENKERINSIESGLTRSIMALGDDSSTGPYRTPSTSEDSPVFTKPIIFPG